MPECVIVLDAHCQISAADVERVIGAHCPCDDYEVVELEAGTLPHCKEHDIGGFLDSRRAYASKMLDSYEDALYCVLVATAYLYPAEVQHAVPADFAVVVERGQRDYPYLVTNPHHAATLRMGACTASSAETLESLGELVLMRLFKLY